jgi:Alg9-like mannosyltransferase family
MQAIYSFFEFNALRKILVIAFAVRLVAVFCAAGYMMHDDHFLTVEPASSWAVGQNFNDWLPSTENNRVAPEPISFLYPGTLMVFFRMMHASGLHDPMDQMLVIRLLHALYSLLAVWLVFKITEKLSNKQNAIVAALLMASLAIIPNYSVRNLVELVCIPPLMAGFWWLLCAQQKVGFQKRELLRFPHFWAAAAIMGLAVGLRFQLGLAIAVVGGVLFFQNGWRSLFAFGITSLLVFSLTQLDDVILWGGKPFQHLMGYFAYNKEHATHYPGSPFTYLSFIGLFIFPPVSLFLLFGFFKATRKHMLIAMPIIAFLIFHVFFPNKQERFILPALPAVLILGVIGWQAFVIHSSFWIRNKKLLWGCYCFFIVLNTIGLLGFSTVFAKKARVEAMHYLYESGDCNNYVLEFTHQDGGAMLPQHYAGQWNKFYYWNKSTNVNEAFASMPAEELDFAKRRSKKPIPNYYLFYDGSNLKERVEKIDNLVGGLQYCTTIESGWFDEILHKLNKKNTIERIHIYKIK